MSTVNDPAIDAIVGAEKTPTGLAVVRVVIKILAAWMVFATSALLVIALLSHKPVFRAVICMGSGLVFLWNVAGGLAMYYWRDRVRDLVRGLPGHWALKFVVFCTVLALAEEVVTTTMTNMAPLLGVKMGEAYVTASANYIDVVAFHSVIVFVPWFIGWAWMLRRWDFHPTFVFFLFGLTGTFAETGFLPGKIAEIGMWLFVYGLMIFLPAYSLPEAKERGARPPRWWLYPLAVFIPFPFMILLLPWGLLKGHFHHPDVNIHFPPIRADV
jgi:hypothetical protein